METLPVHFDPHFLSVQEADALLQYFDDHLEFGIISGSLEDQILKLMLIDEPYFDQFDEQIWGGKVITPAPFATLKKQLSEKFDFRFDVGVCLKYLHGNTEMAYHQDYRAYGDTSVIAGISLGATRTFGIREIATGKEYKYKLSHGSLITMLPGCQEDFQHAVFADPEISEPRINITFRNYGK